MHNTIQDLTTEKNIYIVGKCFNLLTKEKREDFYLLLYPLPYGYQQPVSSHEVKQLKNKTLKNLKNIPP